MPDKKKNSIWWGPPERFADRKDERKISWLELFYDLVYAALIAQLTHHLGAHPDGHGLIYFFFLFAMVFWSWMNGSLYHDLHGSDGIRTRFLTLLQMMAAAAVAITLNDAFAGHHERFAVAFSVVQAIILYLWWSTGYYDPSHRRLNRYYLLLYSIALVLLVISVFTEYAVARYLWGGALLAQLSVGVVAGPSTMREMKRRGETFNLSASVVERFGLFTIIVLGETIFGIVNGISEVPDKNFAVWVAFILGILIAFLLWWIYFDMQGDLRAKRGYWHFQTFMLLHFPLLGSFGVTGACIRVILSHGAALPDPLVLWMFCGAIAVILGTICLLATQMEQNEETNSFVKPVSLMLLGTALLILLVPFFRAALTPVGFIAIIAGLLLTPVLVGTGIWVHYKIFSEQESR